MHHENVLITGGCGLLGQFLIDRMIKAHPAARIRVLDLKPHPYPALDIATFDQVEIITADITRPSSLQGKFEGFDQVVHLAGYISFWIGDRDRLFEVNQVGTRNVVIAARDEGVKDFLHVSSVAAVGYNDREYEPITEDFEFLADAYPNKDYMLSKNASERELRQNAGDMRWIVACPALMFGPGDLTNSIKLINSIRFGKLPVIMPGGTNVADARDIADGILVLLEKGTPGERYLLSGYNLKFSEINEAIARAAGGKAPRHTMPKVLRRPLVLVAQLAEKLARKKPAVTADNIDSAFLFRYFDNRKMKQLGWEPKISLEDSFRDTFEWMQGLPPQVRDQ